MSTHEEEGSAVDRAIGGRVEWLMKRAGGKRHTQMELAAHLGLDQSAVSKKLRGVRPFTVRELYATAEWLGCPAGDIFADRDRLGEPPVVVPRVRRPNISVKSHANRGCVRTTRRSASHRAIKCEQIAA